MGVRVVWSFFKRREPVADPAAQEVPALAGRYRLGQRLGSGASAEVFEVVDLRDGSVAAAKLTPLPAELGVAERADWLVNMQREVNVARRLSHPDILQLRDAGLTDSHAWLVLERVNGHDLGRYTSPERRLPESLVLGIGARVATTLAHAHRHGVVHRDLKPANVLVDLTAGVVKLADFGIARIEDHQTTRTGVTLGTPAYMAPEQLRGHAATPASDAYALGVLLFELLSGRRPHQADTLGALLRATTSQQPAALSLLRPDLPAPLVTLIDHLLRAEPSRRPADLDAWSRQAGALAALIERVLEPGGSVTV